MRFFDNRWHRHLRTRRGTYINLTGANAVQAFATSGTRQLSSPAPSGRKWNPGHYGRSLSKYRPDLLTNIYSDWTNILSSDSRFMGVTQVYPWFALEPTTAGTYTFGPIDNDIAWLNSNFPNAKLLVEVWTRNFNFNASSQPATPQSTTDGNAIVPDYIINGSFTGSGGLPGSTWNLNGLLAAFWSQPVLNRILALDAALGARYDGNATVECIRYDEYSPPGPSAGAPSLGFSRALEQSSWKQLIAGMPANWPTTNAIVMANFPADQNGIPDFGLFSFMQGLPVGAGGPDTLPPVTAGGPSSGESWGELIARGAGVVNGSNFGTVDYRGVLPIIYEAENPNWPMTIPQIETYSFGTLQATHQAWLYNPNNYNGNFVVGAGTTPWTSSQSTANGQVGVVDCLRQNNFRIHSALPTVYT